MGEERLILNETYEKIINDLMWKGYAEINGLIKKETLDGLKKKIKIVERQNLFAPAAIGNQNRIVNKEKRKDNIYWIDKTQGVFEKAFFDEISSLYKYLNLHCFTGITNAEFLLAKYEPNSFYEKHLDGFKKENKRKYSVVTYLNDNWGKEDKGELVLYPMGEKPITMLPEFGKTVIFRSDEMLHEVKPTSRIRYSVTGWLK